MPTRWSRCDNLIAKTTEEVHNGLPLFDKEQSLKYTMKRLTYRRRDGSAAQQDASSFPEIVAKLFKYEEIGLEPEEIRRRLATYSSLLEEVTRGSMIDTRYSFADIRNCYEPRSGEWVLVKDENGRFRNKCSMCGAQIGQQERKTPYCSECGARLKDST